MITYNINTLKHELSSATHYYLNEINEFLSEPEVIECIENNDFDELYRRIKNYDNYGGKELTGVLTATLLLSGIEFLSYQHAVYPHQFVGIESIIKVELPNNIGSIEYGAFFNCESLESVILPPTITSISSFAFKFCKSLTEIVIPREVDYIGGYAFANCKNLKKVIYYGTVKEFKTLIDYNESCFTDSPQVHEIVCVDGVIPVSHDFDD